MSNKLMNLFTGLIAGCALVVTILVVRRELLGTGTDAPPREGRPAPTVIKEWEYYAKGGTTMGQKTAPVVLTVFSDFQCPFCGKMAASYDSLMDKYPSDVQISFRHFPIERLHPHARNSAYASECAARSGKFREYHDILFEKKDSVGLIPWTALASRSGVTDTSAFTDCMKDPLIQKRVDGDVEDARKLGVTGTPAVMINNVKFAGTLPFAMLDSTVKLILEKKGDR